jgi:glycosyltransferase involved in cell wall biosynthesis
MDLVADMLLCNLERNHGEAFTATRIQPPMRRRATRLLDAPDYLAVGPSRGERFLFNADRVLNRFWDYPRYLRGNSAAFDVFHIVDHSYAQLVHVLPPERTIVTCHDLEAFRSVIEPARDPRSRFYTAMAGRILRGFTKAARVTCDSATVRDELLAYALVPPDQVIVAPIGVHPTCTPEPQLVADSEAARLLGPPRDESIELLHVGSTIPRKRIDVLLKVFAAVRKDFPAARLVRVGGAFTPEQAGLVKQLGLEEAIVVLPLLERSLLAAVYRRAALVLQPSDAEGFGLPVAEAMACGTAVIASDIAVLREVGGDAAEYCAVADIPAWRATVGELLTERREAPEVWSARLARGLRQAGRFTWSEYATKMVSVYHQVLGRANFRG